MAKLLNKSIEIRTNYRDPDWQAQDKAAMDAAKAALREKCPGDELVGETVQFGVADGYAVYLVTRSKPLTLQHVDICDGYQVHPALIRGLRLQDVRLQIEMERKWCQLSRSSV